MCTLSSTQTYYKGSKQTSIEHKISKNAQNSSKQAKQKQCGKSIYV